MLNFTIDPISIFFPFRVSCESVSFASAVNAVQEINRVLTYQLVTAGVASRLHLQKDDCGAFDQGHFFEMVCDIPSNMDDTQCICAKTYFKEICVIIIYLEGIFYCILGDATEEQPLLDVDFPDISQEGRGLLLALNDRVSPTKKQNELPQWRKLSLWQACSTKEKLSSPPRLMSLSVPCYQQTYCILKKQSSDANTDASVRNVLFRFGSWCYNGEIELIPQLSIHDIPHVIPTLRIQQHKLSFMSDIAALREDCIFTDPLLYIADLSTKMENEILSVENTIADINFDDNDTDSSFFEFALAMNRDTYLHRNDIDLVATKSHHPNGLVVFHIYFDGAFYVSIRERSGDQTLLDSHFPCVVGHGQGKQLKSYPTGLPGWPEVRKLSLWRNTPSPSEATQGKKGPSNSMHSEGTSQVPVEHFHLKTTNSGDTCEREILFKSNPNIIEEDNEKGSVKIQSGRTFTFRSSREKRKNLGAFHHLAPLQKASILEDAMKVNCSTLKSSEESSPPWDENGRPIIK
jgi:hypothetical protein